jgi:hypothetical protein
LTSGAKLPVTLPAFLFELIPPDAFFYGWKSLRRKIGREEKDEGKGSNFMKTPEMGVVEFEKDRTKKEGK